MTDQNSHDSHPSDSTSRSDRKGLLGTVVGEKYQTVVHLGGGGFGEIYEAVNINMPEQRVVIKFLKLADAKERFKNEARILCQLDHPNICRIIDYLPVEQALVMQYIVGMDCGELFKRHDSIEDSLILKIARSITSALVYAHRWNIAHRDVKPKNIMLDHNGQVYLIDFGIAKAIDATGLTGTARPPFTPQYAAPERHHPGAYDPFLSDIFEVGATILKLAARSTPLEAFHGRSPVGKGRKPLSKKLRKILNKATQQLPDKRYPDMQSLARDFASVDRAYGRSFGWLKVAVVILLLGGTASWFLARPQVVSAYEWARSQFAESRSTETDQPQPLAYVDSTAESSAELEPANTGDQLKSEQVPATKVEAEPPTTNKRERIAGRESVKEEPPAPVEPEEYFLAINANPGSGSRLIVDGDDWPQGSLVGLPKGIHEVVAIHPDYPLIVDTIYLDRDIDLNLDFERKYGATESIKLLYGSSRPLEDVCLRITMNGRSGEYCRVPSFGPEVSVGRWRMEVEVINERGIAQQVDSIVTFPNGSGPRDVILGGEGYFDFGHDQWRDMQRANIVVFWKDQL